MTNAVFSTISVDSPNQVTFYGLGGLTAKSTVSAQLGASATGTQVASTTAATPQPPTVKSGTITNPTTLVIQGTNFDPSGTNLVYLYLNSTATQIFGTSVAIQKGDTTTLTVTLSSPLPPGNILASVTTDGVSSGNPLKIATVLAPSVTPSTTAFSLTPTILTINGSGFDPSNGELNDVALYTGTSANLQPLPSSEIVSVIADSQSQLSVILDLDRPLPAGALWASITTDNLPLPAAGNPAQSVYQVATIVPGGPTVDLDFDSVSRTPASLTITGTGFSANDGVTLYSEAGPITGAVGTIKVTDSKTLTMTIRKPTADRTALRRRHEHIGVNGGGKPQKSSLVMSFRPIWPHRARSSWPRTRAWRRPGKRAANRRVHLAQSLRRKAPQNHRAQRPSLARRP